MIRRRSCASQRGEDPLVGWKSSQPLARGEQPALQTEVVTLAGAGLDVLAVDADSRRAEEPRTVRSIVIVDPDKLDVRANAAGREQLAQMWQQRLMVRTAIEVQNLDPHR